MKKVSSFFAKSLAFFALFVALLSISSQTQAQSFAVAGNLGFNLPIDNQKIGFGAGLKGMYFPSPKFAVGASIQYLRYNYYWDLTMTSYSAFANYYFTESGFRPYVGADLGLYSYRWEFGYTDSSYLGFAPVLGVLYDFNDQWALDVNARYAFLAGSGGFKFAPIQLGVHYYINR
jgi:opacity protein-like surface antigen